MRTPKPLHLNLTPSRWLAAYLLLVHALAVWAILAVIPIPLAILGSFLVLACYLYYWRRFVAFSALRSPLELKFADNCWRVLRFGNQQFESVEWRGATITRYLVVLRLRDTRGRGLNVAVFADQVDSNVFRRLQVIARHARILNP
jgi:hypothetical protein